MDSFLKADHFVPLPPHGDPLPGHGAGGVIPIPGSWPGNFHDDSWISSIPHPAVVPGGAGGGAMPPAPVVSLPHPGPGFGHSFPMKWPSNLVVAMAPADWLAETMLTHMGQNDQFWDNDDDDWDWSQEESDESSEDNSHEDCDESSEENSHEGSHEMGSNENANENSGEGTEGSGSGVESNEDLSNEGK